MCYKFGATFFIRKLDVNILEETIDFIPNDSGIYLVFIVCYHSPVIVVEIIIQIKRALKKLKARRWFRMNQERQKDNFVQRKDFLRSLCVGVHLVNFDCSCCFVRLSNVLIIVLNVLCL